MQNQQYSGYRELRKGRWSGTNHIYLLTSVTRNREKVFEDLWKARTLIQILRRESENGVFTLAFVIMPDHFHWLIQLGEGTLEQSMQRVKSISSRMLGGRVWQPGFHDRALRREEDLLAVARYVVANPLRAGLVERVGDYPHWDAVWV